MTTIRNDSLLWPEGRPTVTGLWIGKDLPPLAELCIRSYQDHGFAFRLLAFDRLRHVPNGTEIVDAREIMDADDLFVHATGSLAPAADRIRYQYLADFGGLWTDMDVVCLKPFPVPSTPWFGLQEPGLANLAVLHFPRDHAVMRVLAHQMEDPAAPMPWDSAEQAGRKARRRRDEADVRRRRIHAEWSLGGPEGFTAALKYHNLLGMAAPRELFSPVPYTCWRWSFDGTLFMGHPHLDRSAGVHLWAELLRREPDAFDHMNSGSLVAQLMAKHGCGRIDRRCRPATNGIKQPPRILVGICSCIRHSERRQAVRDTWFSLPVNRIECRFFVGGAESLSDEPDTVVLPVNDSYEFLPRKVLAFFQHALESSDFDWLFKCDDDTYVALDRLHGLIEPDYDLIGDASVADRGSPSGGAGYFLSRELVEKLVADSSLSPTGPEDIIVGQAAARHGAKFRSDGRLTLSHTPYPSRENQAVSAHWCSPDRLRAIHATLRAEPVGDAVLIHSHWTDRVTFYGDEWFARNATGCCGKWERNANNTLTLHWFDWPAEKFSPEAPPAAEHQFAHRYRSAHGSVEVVEMTLIGGLGNQMFQYSHGLALARRLGARLALRWAEEGRPFALGLFGLALDKVPSSGSSIEWLGTWQDGKDWPTLQAVRECSSASVTVKGWFQNENYFSPVADEIRSKFRLKPKLPDIPSGTTPVCVQVRRGDYVGNQPHDLCGPDYYRNGMSLLRGLIANPWFIVISDDPRWCRETLGDSADASILGNQSEEEALRTMLACQAFIISNSTFGWWGAWLSDAPVVLAPRRFLADKPWNICPERWILLPTDLPPMAGDPPAPTALNRDSLPCPP